MNGASPIELVTHVCNTGSLGPFAAASLSPAVIIEGVKKIRKLTTRPFNVNVFILENSPPAEAEIALAEKLLRPFRDEYLSNQSTALTPCARNERRSDAKNIAPGAVILQQFCSTSSVAPTGCKKAG